MPVSALQGVQSVPTKKTTLLRQPALLLDSHYLRTTTVWPYSTSLGDTILRIVSINRTVYNVFLSFLLRISYLSNCPFRMLTTIPIFEGTNKIYTYIISEVCKIIRNSNLHCYSARRWILCASELVLLFLQYNNLLHRGKNGLHQMRTPVNTMLIRFRI